MPRAPRHPKPVDDTKAVETPVETPVVDDPPVNDPPAEPVAEDPPSTSASLVGAPPDALPYNQGGSAALVGHPTPPTDIEDTPIRGTSVGLSDATVRDEAENPDTPTGNEPAEQATVTHSRPVAAEADTPDGTATGSDPAATRDPFTGVQVHAVGYEQTEPVPFVRARPEAPHTEG